MADIIHAFGRKADDALPETPKKVEVCIASLAVLRTSLEDVKSGSTKFACVIAIRDGYPLLVVSGLDDAGIHDLAALNVALDELKRSIGNEIADFYSPTAINTKQAPEDLIDPDSDDGADD
jgi:hypothetical protein